MRVITINRISTDQDLINIACTCNTVSWLQARIAQVCITLKVIELDNFVWTISDLQDMVINLVKDTICHVGVQRRFEKNGIVVIFDHHSHALKIKLLLYSATVSNGIFQIKMKNFKFDITVKMKKNFMQINFLLWLPYSLFIHLY